MIRSGRYSVAVLSLLLILGIVQVAIASHAWAGYHWARTTTSFGLKLGDNVSGPWDAALSLASSEWSESNVLDTFIVSGSVINPKNCRATAGRVEVCNAKYGYNGWLGIAQIWVTGGVHITQGVTKLNDTYFNSPPYNTTAWRNLVTCQEVGHTFGLNHQDENFNNGNLGTCMDYTNNPDSNQTPNQHDYDQLIAIYGHLDSFTTLDTSTPMPPAMSDIDFEGPGQWGRLVSESAKGKKSVYEADLGGGNKVVTFVTWADGEERGRGRER